VKQSWEELPIGSARTGVKLVYATCVSSAESQVVWERDYINGWLARSVCAACLCFVPRDYLVCSIAFVVYIHGWTIYILYDAGLMPVCVSRRSYVGLYGAF